MTVSRESWGPVADLISATFKPAVNLDDALAREGWYMAISDQSEEILSLAVVAMIRGWQGPPPRPADLRRCCLEAQAKKSGIDLNAQAAFAECQAWAAKCNGASPENLPPPPSPIHAAAVKEMGGLWAFWRMSEEETTIHRAQFAKLWASLVAKVNLASIPATTNALPEVKTGPRKALGAPIHAGSAIASVLPPPPPPPPPGRKQP